MHFKLQQSYLATLAAGRALVTSSLHVCDTSKWKVKSHTSVWNLPKKHPVACIHENSHQATFLLFYCTTGDHVVTLVIIVTSTYGILRNSLDLTLTSDVVVPGPLFCSTVCPKRSAHFIYSSVVWLLQQELGTASNVFMEWKDWRGSVSWRTERERDKWRLLFCSLKLLHWIKTIFGLSLHVWLPRALPPAWSCLIIKFCHL